MMVGRRWQVQQGLEQDLGVGGVEQVVAAYDIGNALPCIIDHDGQMVGDANVLAAEDDIAIDLWPDLVRARLMRQLMEVQVIVAAAQICTCRID